MIREQNKRDNEIIPHFEPKIQPILRKHGEKMRLYNKKVQLQQKLNQIEFDKKNIKELPTVISIK